MPVWCDDDVGNDVPYGMVGAASTLNVTNPDGEETPPRHPIGFVWPEKEPAPSQPIV